MKKIFVMLAVVSFFATSSRAAELIDIHNQVNNAQAPEHQMQSSATPAEVQGKSGMKEMNTHERAVVAHNTMNEGSAEAHQKMAAGHQKKMKTDAGLEGQTAKSFTETNEHEKAAIAHETMKNGQSGAHEKQAEKHRKQVSQN